MKEKVKQIWNEHKEEIKTGAILVLTPIAVIGLLSLRSLNNLTHFLSNASDQVIEKK